MMACNCCAVVHSSWEDRLVASCANLGYRAMSTYVKLTVCRRLDNRVEGLDDDSPRAAELHLLRSRALHDILDRDPAWAVGNWGDTDDVRPHEWVELWAELRDVATIVAPVAIPALVYVGRVLLDTGVSAAAVEGIKRLFAKFRKKQEEGQTSDVTMTFTDETTVSCQPDSGILTVTLHTFASVSYDAAHDQIAGLEARPSEAIDVPIALVPFVRQLISKRHAG